MAIKAVSLLDVLTPAWESKSHELLNVFGEGDSCEDQTCQSQASTGQALQESEEGRHHAGVGGRQRALDVEHRTWALACLCHQVGTWTGHFISWLSMEKLGWKAVSTVRTAHLVSPRSPVVTVTVSAGIKGTRSPQEVSPLGP